MRTIAAAILSAIALGGWGQAAAQQRLGPGNPESCYQVQNTAPFTILTHVILPSRARSVARIETNKSARYCLAGTLFDGGQVNFRVVSGLGPPLFSCMTKIDKVLVVSARKKPEGGYEYNANCT